jgi:hypothetical protein
MSSLTSLHGGGPSGIVIVGFVVGADASGVGVGRVRSWQFVDADEALAAGLDDAAIVD